jgi:prolyl 4-hydroxylase
MTLDSLSLQPLGADIFQVDSLLDPSLCAHVLQVASCYEFHSPPSGSSLTGELRSQAVLPFAEADELLASTSQLLLGCLSPLRDRLEKHYQVSFRHAELYSIDRYQPGQAYKRHFDGLILGDRYAELSQGIPARDVSIVCCLNADFSGGEVLFDRQSIKVKPAIGNAIVFPACYTHPYQTLPVLQGCKYTFTAWLLH